MESKEYKEGWQAASDWLAGTFAPPGEYADQPFNPYLKNVENFEKFLEDVEKLNDWNNGFDGFNSYFGRMSA